MSIYSQLISAGTTGAPTILTEEKNSEDIEEAEKNSYNELISEGGIPSFPIEDKDEILVAPRKYKDILNYWYSKTNSDLLFHTQLREWRGFQKFQHEARQEFQNNWTDYQNDIQNCRRHHNLERTRIPQKDLGSQVQMATWQEYLYFHHRGREEERTLMEQHEKRYEATLIDSQENDLTRQYNVNGNFHDYTEPLDLQELLLSAIRKEEEKRAILNEKLSVERDRLRSASDCPGDTISEAVWVLPLEAEVKRLQDKRACCSSDEKDRISHLDRELKQASDRLYAGQSDFKNNPKRGALDKRALIDKLQREIQTGQNKLDEANAEYKLLESHIAFAHAWFELIQARRKFYIHHSLIRWIKLQHRQMVANLRRSFRNSQDAQENAQGYGKRKLQSINEPEQSPQNKEARGSGTQLEGVKLLNQRVLRSHTAAKRVAEAKLEQDEKNSNKRQRTAPKDIAKPAVSKAKQRKPTPRPRKTAAKNPSPNPKILDHIAHEKE